VSVVDSAVCPSSVVPRLITDPPTARDRPPTLIALSVRLAL